MFKGEVESMLTNIKYSTGVAGCALTAENLLYFADAIKSGNIKKDDFMELFGSGQEIVYSNYEVEDSSFSRFQMQKEQVIPMVADETDLDYH